MVRDQRSVTAIITATIVTVRVTVSIALRMTVSVTVSETARVIVTVRVAVHLLNNCKSGSPTVTMRAAVNYSDKWDCPHTRAHSNSDSQSEARDTAQTVRRGVTVSRVGS